MLLSRIANLHNLLESRDIKNKDKKISLSKVFIKRNPKNIEETLYRITYSFKYEENKIKCVITNASCEKIFEFIDDSKNYSKEKFQKELNKSGLNETQKNCAISFYKELSPIEEINLTNITNDECYEIGQFKFIRNEEYLFQALIETIYDIRCLLFHGDIDPEENEDVYEQAYYIVKHFVGIVNKT